MVCLDLLKFNPITLSTCTHATFIRMLTSWCTVQGGYWCLEGWQRLLSFGTPARPCIHTYEGSGVKETAGHLKNSWHLLLLMTKNATTVDSNISSETWSRLSVQGFYQRCTISVHGCYRSGKGLLQLRWGKSQRILSWVRENWDQFWRIVRENCNFYSKSWKKKTFQITVYVLHEFEVVEKISMLNKWWESIRT